MEKELLFTLAFIGLVLVLMRPRNYKRWTAWLGRRSRNPGSAPARPRQHRVRPEAARLSDEDVAARLERAWGDAPEIREELLVRIAAELNAYRVSPWGARKVVWIQGLEPRVAERLARAMVGLELAEVPVIAWPGEAPSAGRWVCVVTGNLPDAENRTTFGNALVFLLGPELKSEGLRVERWDASSSA